MLRTPCGLDYRVANIRVESSGGAYQVRFDFGLMPSRWSLVALLAIALTMFLLAVIAHLDRLVTRDIRD